MKTKKLSEKEMAQKVAERVAAAGGRAYFVGGFVRDKIMGYEGKDMDIEVHGVETEGLEKILDSLAQEFSFYHEAKHICKGRLFGVYGISGYEMDIAMPRTEKSTGRGHKDFQVFVDSDLGIEKAARRRDFTFNAMMEDVLSGEVFDFFEGEKDLKNGIIRHIDDNSFTEDPLRVLRAAQFAARFNLKLSEETKELCRKINITGLSSERVFAEMSKALLKSQKPSIFFETLKELEQLDYWFRELLALVGVKQPLNYHPEGDVWVHTMQVLDFAACFSLEESLKPANRLYFLLSALCHDLGKPETTAVIDGRIRAIGHEEKGKEVASKFLKRLTLERELHRYVLNMVELHMKPNMLCGQQSGEKATNRMFDKSIDPEGLLLLARCDRTKPDNLINFELQKEKNEVYEKWLWERLELFRNLMALPEVTGEDLIVAGVSSGFGFSELINFGHSLHLAKVPKEDALAQVLALAKEKGMLK